MAQLSMLALGDSYTIGERVAEPQRWPNQLAQIYRQAGIPLCPPLIIAQTGWTADELEAALDDTEQALIRSPYDLVSLLTGVNDQYRGRPLSAFEPAFQRLLARAIAYAGGNTGRVLVLSIPDWGVTPFAAEQGREADQIARQIDAYNALCQRESEASGVSFIDITDLTRQAPQRPELLTDDGLHPSGVDYARWAQRVRQRLDALGWPESVAQA